MLLPLALPFVRLFTLCLSLCLTLRLSGCPILSEVCEGWGFCLGPELALPRPPRAIFLCHPEEPRDEACLPQAGICFCLSSSSYFSSPPFPALHTRARLRF